MKTIKTILLATILVFSSHVSAITENPKNEFKSVSEQIENLLKGSELVIYKDVGVKLKFKLNENNKIVILTNNSNDYYISEFINKRLYLKELKIDKKNANKFYYVPIKFISNIN
ncbi:hypothetical protein [uncultured Algibacter sp.]|uniref:hypothetical protein n=1 Tax=uncultured Algibacter sp. TaxID=298659 RepID=UPI002627B64F|nr:hypothetical protein [uncultured Algibacter sp.]